MTSDPADLTNLRDIVLPPLPLWPPAPGAWIILLGILAASLVMIRRAYERYRSDAYRREALRELSASPDMTAILPLLKRAALVAYGREKVASLSGDAFLAFLDRTGGTMAFTSGPARLLPELAYTRRAAMTADDRAAVVADARRWLRSHRAREG
ncbi:DUF4381 domain-containing protein [Microvirga rosea]|uniref:DUF4381 domain-containing protein n=1 Tax=Microvirga rosea TaxID=2715425 RepID=UPI001D0B0D82|nr:DUF4381 domain-containing protein [Microvirga rosea]MCB8821975.1 DUF4381 domain-containing protein [Microvirga rosea]